MSRQFGNAVEFKGDSLLTLPWALIFGDWREEGLFYDWQTKPAQVIGGFASGIAHSPGPVPPQVRIAAKIIGTSASAMVYSDKLVEAIGAGLLTADPVTRKEMLEGLEFPKELREAIDEYLRDADLFELLLLEGSEYFWEYQMR